MNSIIYINQFLCRIKHFIHIYIKYSSVSARTAKGVKIQKNNALNKNKREFDMG